MEVQFNCERPFSVIFRTLIGWGSYPSAEMQSVYSTALADWASHLAKTYIHNRCADGGARGVMVIVAGIGHGDTSSNPGLIAFHIALIPLGKV